MRRIRRRKASPPWTERSRLPSVHYQSAEVTIGQLEQEDALSELYGTMARLVAVKLVLQWHPRQLIATVTTADLAAEVTDIVSGCGLAIETLERGLARVPRSALASLGDD